MHLMITRNLGHAGALVGFAIHLHEAILADAHPAKHTAINATCSRSERLLASRHQAGRNALALAGVDELSVEFNLNPGFRHGISVCSIRSQALRAWFACAFCKYRSIFQKLPLHCQPRYVLSANICTYFACRIGIRKPLQQQWSEQLSFSLNDKVAFVTGGYRGLGAAIINCLASHGATGAAVDRDTPDRARLLPNGFVAIQADVTDESAVKSAIDRTIETFGRIDIVVANAGVVPPWSETRELDLQQWDAVMAVNARGVLTTIKHTVEPLTKSKGNVVVMGSINSVLGHQRQMAYTASKHAALGIVRAAALDLGRFGIRVNGVAPGPIATEALLDRIRSRAQTGPSELEAIALLENQTALGRLATAEEVANTVAFLSCSAAGGISGQMLRVDAGMA
jgi:NAD(P)-dependent dehydrogenase (short-subunit alcohol dehydrogenase family)